MNTVVTYLIAIPVIAASFAAIAAIGYYFAVVCYLGVRGLIRKFQSK